MDELRITYHGHSCFTLEYQGQRIVVDPYKDGMIPGLPPLHLEAEWVYCSHEHEDHNYRPAVSLQPCDAPNLTVEELETDHDDAGGTLRGKNTVRVFRFGTLRVAHFGDLGRELTAEELRALQDMDCALLPTGGFYTVGPETAQKIARLLQPRVLIPMHYRTAHSGFEVLKGIDPFLNRFDCVERCGKHFCLTEKTSRGVVVMDPFAEER